MSGGGRELTRNRLKRTEKPAIGTRCWAPKKRQDQIFHEKFCILQNSVYICRPGRENAGADKAQVVKLVDTLL